MHRKQVFIIENKSIIVYTIIIYKSIIYIKKTLLAVVLLLIKNVKILFYRHCISRLLFLITGTIIFV